LLQTFLKDLRIKSECFFLFIRKCKDGIDKYIASTYALIGVPDLYRYYLVYLTCTDKPTSQTVEIATQIG